MASVQVDLSQAVQQLRAAWSGTGFGAAVTSWAWDAERGSLAIEASGLRAALALSDRNMGAQVDAMCSLEAVVVAAHLTRGGHVMIEIRSESWQYSFRVQGIAITVPA